MEETVQDRIHLLLESGQISPKTALSAQRLMDRVSRYLGKPVSGDNAIMFVTHIALAMERLAEGEPLMAGLPDDLLEEVRARTADWQFAQSMAEFVQQETGAAFPEGEIGYLAAHVGALSLSSENGEDQ